jgi:uncharacterized repeat protein (TIGR01451 family)
VTLLIALLVPATAASANTFTVNTEAGGSDTTPGDGICFSFGNGCTLRAAVEEANAFPGPDTIAVPAGTFTLAGPTQLAITSSVTLTGAGARATTIDAGDDSRVIQTAAESVAITDLTITGGRDENEGAGVLVIGPDAHTRLERVTVRGNEVIQTGPGGAFGGGVYQRNGGSVTVRDSTITDNEARGDDSQGLGGGIGIEDTGTLVNVTIAGNRGGSLDSNSFGGGVFSRGPVTLDHVTLSANEAGGLSAGTGGNVYTDSMFVDSATTLRNTIVAGGVAGPGANCGGEAPAEQGRNLASDSSCSLGPGNPVGVDPQLAPLGDHGGPTDTRAVKFGSPAVDAATACADSGRDQRGQGAPAGAACDLGATELAADMEAGLTASTANAEIGDSVTFVATATNRGFDTAPGARVDVTPPAGTTVTFVAGSSGSCSGTAPVHCDFGELPRGASATATIVVKVDAPGSLTASSTVAASPPDSSGANNTATAVVTVPDPVFVPPPPPGDVTAPVLTNVRLIGRLRARRGGRLGFTIDEAATLRVRADRLLAGRRKGRRCVVGRRRGKRCTKAVRVGTRQSSVAAGAGSVRLPARWGRNRLRAGRLRLTLTAIDAAGNRSAPVRRTVRVRR